jgi:heat shock protein HtpX
LCQALPSAFGARRRRRHKLLNVTQSLLLLAGMLAILALCAWTIWGARGVLWALVAGGASLLLTPAVAPEWIMRMYRAVPVGPRDLPEAHRLLQQLSARADLPRPPRLFYLPSSLLNAFAVGNRDGAAIAVTDGLLRVLTAREFAGVLAHELSHVRNNDLWLMGLADLMSRLTSLMSWLGQLLLILNLPVLMMGGEGVPWLLVLVLIFAPTVMALLQLALSRAREYDADLDAAGLTGDPKGLASALAKLERYQGRYWEEILLPGRRIPEPSLLRTHPPTRERIDRLLALAEDLPPPGEPAAPVAALHAPAWTGAAPAAPRWRWPGVWY